MKNLNLNADFLLDIWADIKAKKLAPVAIGLAVVAVGMPALMLKGDDAAVDGPLPIVAPVEPESAKVEVADELAEGSKLDSYEARDPFEGLIKPEKDDSSGSSGAAIVPSDALGPDKGPSAPSSPPVPSGPSDSGGSPGSNQGPGSDPNLPSSRIHNPPMIVKRRSRFNYQLDLKVGRPGREKRFRNVARLTFLPSQSSPALLFMGVAEDEKTALFFVHPGLSHAGEGSCLPSNTRCNFLTLRIGQEHFLSANDHEFHVTLLGIKRVKVSAEKAQREQVRKASASRRSHRAGDDAEGVGAAEEEFEMPLLVDAIG